MSKIINKNLYKKTLPSILIQTSIFALIGGIVHTLKMIGIHSLIGNASSPVIVGLATFLIGFLLKVKKVLKDSENLLIGIGLLIIVAGLIKFMIETKLSF